MNDITATDEGWFTSGPTLTLPPCPDPEQRIHIAATVALGIPEMGVTLGPDDTLTLVASKPAANTREEQDRLIAEWLGSEQHELLGDYLDACRGTVAHQRLLEAAIDAAPVCWHVVSEGEPPLAEPDQPACLDNHPLYGRGR